jgi:hypothetical protein
MEVVIMARQVQFPSKYYFLLLLILSACKPKAVQPPAPNAVMINSNSAGLKMANGILLLNAAPFTGKIFSLFASTTDTAEISAYLNGRENGEWKKYYPANQLKEKRYFTNGEKSGEYIAWWENGKPQLQYFFQKGEYNGTCREWNSNGKLTRILNFKLGHEEGLQQWWYDNGKIKANYIVRDGRRFGLLGTKNCINVSDSIFSN